MSKDKETVFYRERRWLTPPARGLTSYIKAYIAVDEIGYLDCVLEIADCSRKISLEFDSGFGRSVFADAAADVKKLDVLIDTLTHFKHAYQDAVEQAAPLRRHELAEHKKKNRAKKAS